MLLPHRVVVGRVVIPQGANSAGVIVAILGPTPPKGWQTKSKGWGPMLCRVKMRDGKEIDTSSEFMIDEDFVLAAKESALHRRLAGRGNLAALGALPRDPAAEAQDLKLARKMGINVTHS
jgi:hypothetical protein